MIAVSVLPGDVMERVAMTDPQYIKAKREVSVLKGFFIHTLVFACVISAPRAAAPAHLACLESDTCGE